MAMHSSILAWAMPWTEQPGGLQPMCSRVRHDFWVHSQPQHSERESESLSRVRLRDPKDCSPPGCSVHGISQARILEWVTMPFSTGLPDPAIRPGSPALQADSPPFEPPGKQRFILAQGSWWARSPPWHSLLVLTSHGPASSFSVPAGKEQNEAGVLAVGEATNHHPLCPGLPRGLSGRVCLPTEGEMAGWHHRPNGHEFE